MCLVLENFFIILNCVVCKSVQLHHLVIFWVDMLIIIVMMIIISLVLSLLKQLKTPETLCLTQYNIGIS